MKTPMEFALELGQRFQGPVWAEQIAEILVIRDAEIRQACAAEYQPMLDELRKLAEEWNREVTGGEYSDLLRCSDQLLAVLDRSGARGGASRNEPERLVDNSSFTEDRSRTEWLRLQGRKI